MKISCKESCKKTTQMRESKHCTGSCEVVAGQLVFGCDESIKISGTIDDSNFYTCSFWDMNLKDTCAICPLSCKENKNPVVANAKTAVKNLSSILESISPLMQMSGINPEILKKAYNVMDSASTATNTSSTGIEDTIQVVNYAKGVLDGVMSGKNIDIAEFRKVKELLEKRYRKQ